MNYESDTSDKGTVKAESDVESVKSEVEMDKKVKKRTEADSTSRKSEDTVSIHTYTSVEHAYDRDVKKK